MGAWAYCDRCEGPLDRPSAHEAVHGRRICCHCRGVILVSHGDKDSLIVDMAARIDDLEEAVRRLQQKGNA